MAVDVAIIIVNFRTPDLTIDCLASLEAEIEPGVRVVVVDNASGDGSAETIAKAVVERGWGEWTRLLRSPVNGGFASGNNFGIRSQEAAAYLLLNSDTVVRPGAIRALREAMRLHPEAGIIGAGILTPRGEPDHSAFRAPGPIGELIRAANTGIVTRALGRFDVLLPKTEQPFEPDWLGFVCVLVRAEVLRAVGYLDEGYFMYFEDVDFCRQARAAGWRILYWPSAKVVHFLSSSSKVSGQAVRRRGPRYYYEARARYFAKFYGRSGLWLANALWCAGRLVSLVREIFGRPPSDRTREALDIWTNAMTPLRPRPGRAA